MQVQDDKTLPPLKEIFYDLNELQFEAVTAPADSTLQIIAGPGTGKTKVLTCRVAYLLLYQNYSPRDIIVTTFTKKAAKEMIERLQLVLKDYLYIDPNSLIIGTFHSICFKLLKRNCKRIGLDPDFKVADERDSNDILKKIIRNAPDHFGHMGPITSSAISGFRSYISRAKSEGKFPEQMKLKGVRGQDSHLQVYEMYMDTLKKEKMIDFDDCLLFTKRLLTENPQIVSRIRHVLVDEFQDTNEVQMDLVYLFSEHDTAFKDNVTVVGDPDQSIYGFRNSISDIFERKEKHYLDKPDNKFRKIILKKNYRSTKNILDAAELVMSQQYATRQAKQLENNLELNFPVHFEELMYGKEEPYYLGKKVEYLIGCCENVNFGDIAVLLRKSSLSRKIEEEFRKKRIPYRILRGTSFWERKEIKFMIYLLRAVGYKTDWLAYDATMNVPKRGLGDKFLENLKLYCDKFQRNSIIEFDTIDIFNKIVQGKLDFKINTKQREGLSDYVNLIIQARDILKDYNNMGLGTRLELAFKHLVEKSGIIDAIISETEKKAASEISEKKELMQENIDEFSEQFLTFEPIENDDSFFDQDGNINGGPIIYHGLEQVLPDVSDVQEVTEADDVHNDSDSDSIEIVDVREVNGRGDYKSCSADEADEVDYDIGNISMATQERFAKMEDTIFKDDNPGIRGRKFVTLFLEGIKLYDETPKDAQVGEYVSEEEKNNVITISTIHASKGLEWPVVFIPSLVDGIIPSSQSLSEEGERAEKLLDEERRCLYVAITRAKYKVFLSSYKKMGDTETFSFSYDRPLGTSRFVTPIRINKSVCYNDRFANMLLDQTVYKYELKNSKYRRSSRSSKDRILDFQTSEERFEKFKVMHSYAPTSLVPVISSSLNKIGTRETPSSRAERFKNSARQILLKNKIGMGAPNSGFKSVLQINENGNISDKTKSALSMKSSFGSPNIQRSTNCNSKLRAPSYITKGSSVSFGRKELNNGSHSESAVLAGVKDRNRDKMFAPQIVRTFKPNSQSGDGCSMVNNTESTSGGTKRKRLGMTRRITKLKKE
ncbi:nucleoside-triphosphatase activity protein [[Candida] boidinii]|nr:nucleoside-triphosphatase activity protein [[Candida] boidinii]